MTAYLNDDKPDASAPKSDLTYYSVSKASNRPRRLRHMLIIPNNFSVLPHKGLWPILKVAFNADAGRNFTTYQHRFRMPGSESGGVGNFWYSFDYGLAHFVSIDGETDFPYSPEWPFVADVDGK